MTPDAYIICTSPRSGSTLLCDLLRQTNVAGAPDSHFHRPSVETWRRDHGCPENTPLSDVFQAAIKTGRGNTPVFALRLQRHSFDFFMQKLADLHPDHPNDLSRLQAAFGNTRFIHLTRQDKLAQAISLVRAQQSGLWHKAPDGREIERVKAPEAEQYDPAAIQAGVDEFTGYDRDWLAWLAAQNIRPHRITYENLSQDPVNILRDTLRFLNLPLQAADGIRPGVAKLADARSKDWYERFQEEQK